MPWYPYRKRRPYRKRPYRKRYAKGKRKLVRKLKSSNNQINIKQTVRDLVTLETPQMDIDRPCNDEQFMLNAVPRHAEFKSMFDKYKINGVKLIFTLQGDTSHILQTNGLSMVYRVDTDGHSVVDTASVNTMLQSGNCKVVNFNQNRTSCSIFLKPRTLSPLYCGAGSPFGYNGGNNNIWLDTNATNILHYGLQWGFMNPSNTLGEAVTIQVTKIFYLSFKGIIATAGAATTLTDTTNIRVDPVPVPDPSGNTNQAQIDALQAQIDQLMDAHDSDNDHDPSGNVSHPDAAYY